MNIAVLIPSRGRTRQLAAALTTLHMCQSGENNVRYCVAVDDDDLPTKIFVENASNEIPLAMRLGPRPDALGSIANDLAAHWSADVYAVWADDLICLSYGWDAKISDAARACQHGVFWWTTPRDAMSLVPIVTEKWREAAGGIFTEHFPFWYDDLWLFELWLMATEQDPIMLDISVLDKPQSTQRMRDLGFWMNFYHSMRAHRVEEGKRIAAKLGLPAPVIGPAAKMVFDKYAERSEETFQDIMRRNKAETGEPSAYYLRAKAKAEALMREAA